MIIEDNGKKIGLIDENGDPMLQPSAQPEPLAPQPGSSVKVHGDTELHGHAALPGICVRHDYPDIRFQSVADAPPVKFPEEPVIHHGVHDAREVNIGYQRLVGSKNESTEAVITEGVKWWKDRRSLTIEEAKKLRVPKSQLHCSVMYFPGAPGYVAFTHRARSKVFRSPGEIPAKDLNFISSTA